MKPDFRWSRFWWRDAGASPGRTWKRRAVLPKTAFRPSVTWKTDDMRPEILPWVDGRDEDLTLHVTYRLECRKPASGPPHRHGASLSGESAMAAFRNLGGCSPIHRISCDADGMRVDGRNLAVQPAADAHGVAAFEDGGFSGPS